MRPNRDGGANGATANGTHHDAPEGTTAFLVRIVGRNLSATEDGKPALWGFVTTRYVRATTPGEAGQHALAKVTQECARLTRVGAPPAEISLHRIEALSEAYDGPRPTTGFTFFDEECH